MVVNYEMNGSDVFFSYLAVHGGRQVEPCWSVQIGLVICGPFLFVKVVIGKEIKTRRQRIKHAFSVSEVFEWIESLETFHTTCLQGIDWRENFKTRPEFLPKYLINTYTSLYFD